MNVGYYWSGMHKYTVREIKMCDSCQCHSSNILHPENELVPVTASWPFQKWAIDIMGPFPKAPDLVKYLNIAIDYFTKWVKPKPIASITAANMKIFIWEIIICCFGLRWQLWVIMARSSRTKGYKIGWRNYTFLKYLLLWHTSKPMDRLNVLTGVSKMETKLDLAPSARLGRWVSTRAMGSRTHKKRSNSETPFSLIYGSEAMILAKIGVPSARTLLITNNDKELCLNLDLLEEGRELALIREINYKCQLQKYCNAWVKICQFYTGEYVFRNNEASNSEVLGKAYSNLGRSL